MLRYIGYSRFDSRRHWRGWPAAPTPQRPSGTPTREPLPECAKASAALLALLRRHHPEHETAGMPRLGVFCPVARRLYHIEVRQGEGYTYDEAIQR